MSTPADPALISELTAAVILQYCNLSAVVMLIYYYLTTLGEEFKHYLDRRATLATVLYIANRYIPLVFNLFGTWMTYSSNQRLCAAQMGIAIGLEYLQYFPWAIFSALRTYALQRKVHWAVLILVLSLSSVIVSSVTDHWVVIQVDPEDGCIASDDIPLWFQHSYKRVPMIIADIAIIVITWKTQYKTYNLGRRISTASGLAMVLLRDSTVYFVALTILNTLLLPKILGAGTDGHNSALVSFIEPLTAILVSEFLTNLHEAADRTSGMETLTTVQSTLEFRIIGSIGASLHGGTLDIAPNDTEHDDICEDPEEARDDDIVRSAVEVEEIPQES
ncbi:hypothetical protein ONZ51_g10617 [Trametes cubensis]|uniref:DUF6533 domain-containing protein n=1 Tax=Trametes cubensis TaxID=1111947 RepID=A0AAD7X6I9_9APHY|nr:hypothetical protein ONZ51_g10617 [Trametes cubensis]